MRPTLERIYLDVEDAENKMVFVSLHEASGVEHPALDEYLQAESCKPRFVMLLGGNVVGNVDGALSPSVSAAITENIPADE